MLASYLDRNFLLTPVGVVVDGRTSAPGFPSTFFAFLWLRQSIFLSHLRVVMCRVLRELDQLGPERCRQSRLQW